MISRAAPASRACPAKIETRTSDSDERFHPGGLALQRRAAGPGDSIEALSARKVAGAFVISDFLQPPLPDELLERAIQRCRPELDASAAQFAHVLVNRSAIAWRGGNREKYEEPVRFHVRQTLG